MHRSRRARRMQPWTTYSRSDKSLTANNATCTIGTGEKLQLATELRDSIEIVHTSEYLNFLKAFFPAFRRVLAGTKPQFKDCDEHKLRNAILEILNRLPHNEVIRPFSHDLMKLCLGTLETDNEDNAMISLRIIFDLHKNFRPSLEAEVRPFLDFVAKVSSCDTATMVSSGRFT